LTYCVSLVCARDLSVSAQGPVTQRMFNMATETEIPRIRLPDDLQSLDPSTPERMRLLDFVLLLAEGRRLLGAITFLFLGFGLLLAFVLPVRYKATVVILPPQQNSSFGGALASQLEGLSSIAALAGGGLGLKNPNDMYVSMLKSQSAEDGLIGRFALEKEYHRRYLSDTRKTLERRSEIEGGLKDGLIRISVEDHDPDRARDMANGYVDELRELSRHLAVTEAAQRRVFFQAQLDQTRSDLAGAEDAMERAEQHTGLIQLDSQARALIESGAMLRAQIAAKEVQIQGMRNYATGENAAVSEAEQELAGLRAQLAKLGGSEGQGSDELIVPKGQIPAAGLEYERRLRDVRYYEAEFSILARQLELARLDEAREGSMIQVVDPAVVPDKRSYPNRILLVVSFLFAGIICGILSVLAQAAVLRANRDITMHDKFARLKAAFGFADGSRHDR
jgi:tyrosine-protein kinase Etk/Wzc